MSKILNRLICAIAAIGILLAPVQIQNANASTFSQFFTSIKSIQRGTIAVASGATSATATISAVTTSKSSVQFLGFSCACTPLAADGSEYTYVVLTNTTTVTATRVNLNSSSIVVAWEVVEYY